MIIDQSMKSPLYTILDKYFSDEDGKQSVRPRLFVTGKGVAWLSKKYGKGGDE